MDHRLLPSYHDALQILFSLLSVKDSDLAFQSHRKFVANLTRAQLDVVIYCLFFIFKSSIYYTEHIGSVTILHPRCSRMKVVHTEPDRS